MREPLTLLLAPPVALLCVACGGSPDNEVDSDPAQGESARGQIVEIDDAHGGAPAVETSDWNMYVVTQPDGEVVVGYMAHHLADAKLQGLPVGTSDSLPDYFAYPKNELLNAAFEGKPSKLLNGALDGAVFRFFVGTVLAYGVPETMRKGFESDVASGLDAASLKKKYPGIANAYSPAQWDKSFASKLGAGAGFGAQWGKFVTPA